ncbi:MAG: FAD/NAD(P)-binding oxidoreductase [Gemmatimonadota bacterium]
MPQHRYLIIGGGITADAAARGIRSVDADASIGILSEEADAPYDRPALSKGLWKGWANDRILRGTDALEGVQLHLGRRAQRIDPDPRTVLDEQGTIYSYDRLLIATGLSANTLPDAVPQVIHFRTLDDYRKLRAAVATGSRVVVVGGGFVGTELAAVLTEAGKQVTLLFPEDRVLAPITTPGVGDELAALYRARGVDVRPGCTVAAVRRSGPRFLVAVSGATSETLRADVVVAGIGASPNLQLAAGARLEIDDGIVVDASFRSSDPNIFAAGDVAAFWSPTLGRTLRVEHEDHANHSGFLAGQAMAGLDVTYEHLPFFYSDIFDQHYDCVGEVGPGMEIYEDWAEPNRRGVVYYLRSGRVRGVCLWNLPGRIDASRELIRGNRPHVHLDPTARLPLP